MDARGLPPAFVGTPALDPQGATVGVVADVLFDERSHRPGWMLLVLPRARRRFVHAPAAGARHSAAGIVLDVAADLVRSAPAAASPPDALGPAQAQRLAAHYGVRVQGGPWSGVVEPSVAERADRLRPAA